MVVNWQRSWLLTGLDPCCYLLYQLYRMGGERGMVEWEGGGVAEWEGGEVVEWEGGEL